MSCTSGSLPSTAPLTILDQSSEVSYVLSEDLDITYCNPAWDDFAREQGGSATAMSVNVVGRGLLEFLPPELRDFYVDLFAGARMSREPVSHDYECSSAHVFRLYRMHIYPLQRGAGFVVQNSLRVERLHDRAACEPSNALYGDDQGWIHACANCRRTQRARSPAVWDWVPAYLANPELKITHGVCPMCMEFYYMPVIRKYSAA